MELAQVVADIDRRRGDYEVTKSPDTVSELIENLRLAEEAYPRATWLIVDGTLHIYNPDGMFIGSIVRRQGVIVFDLA